MKPGQGPVSVSAALVLAILAGSCGSGDRNASDHDAGDRHVATASVKPPVILISIDTLRSDHLPVYGYGGVETPALDRFAEEAVVFERAYSHYPLTLPSHISLLTGRLPASAGVRNNSEYRLEENVQPYLPEVLSRKGYATIGAVSTFVLRADTGIARGFDSYFDMPLPAPPTPTIARPRARPRVEEAELVSLEQRAGSETLAKVLPWLSSHTGSPFFLFFHIYEPHLPHQPPEPFRSRWGDTYEGEIAMADHVVGELLDELRRKGVYDDSLIFVFSDHGEELGEHGEEGHGLLLYRQSLQVPLMMKLPKSLGAGGPAGSRYPNPVQLADVLPTVLDVLDIENPGQGQDGRIGESLMALMSAGPGDEHAASRPIFSETLYPRIRYGWHELTSLIQGDLHLVAGLRAEVFDLAADPGETRDILRDHRREYRSLDEVRAGLATPFEQPTQEEDEETQKRLASLGYLSSIGHTGAPTKDPRDVVPEFAPRLKRADDALRAHRDHEAARLFEELVALDDQMPETWQGLGMARMVLDDYAGALAALTRALRLDPKPSTALMAARCLLELGRLDEAEEHVKISLEKHEAGSRDLMVLIQVARGRFDEAVRWAEQDEGLLDLTPPTLLHLARALAQDRRVDEARRALDVLIRVDPSAVAWNELARLALESGDATAARQALDRAMALEPRNAGSLEWLGLLELQQGRVDEAKTLLEESVGKDAERSNAWNLLAVARFQLHDGEGALAAWQQAARLDPSHLDALFNLGLTAARMGRRDVALRALRRYEKATEELPRADPARAQERSEVRTMIERLEAQ